jgi:AMMECR1 domain-containing protein
VNCAAASGRSNASGRWRKKWRGRAADSAVRDPRFPPVTPDELPDLSLEISVLSPLEPIDPARRPGPW